MILEKGGLASERRWSALAHRGALDRDYLIVSVLPTAVGGALPSWVMPSVSL